MFCVLCAASQPFRNTCLLISSLGTNTMVHNPMERTAAHFSGKTTENKAKMTI